METHSGMQRASEVDAVGLVMRHARRVGELIEALPARWEGAPPGLVESMMYSLRAGGKRLRPALVLEAFGACGGGEKLRGVAEAAALAIEMVHTFSLVHDDLPAMDDDDLRRGKPTNHKVFGEAMAILAGDALLSGAFELLADDIVPAELSRRLARELAAATGPCGMVGGQVLDMAAEGRKATSDELARIHRLKTGALLTAGVRLGAVAADAPAGVLEAITAYGRHVGLAFQIVDDILDVTSTPEQMGKATKKDAAAGKNTYPGLHGLDASRAKAAEELRLGLQALAPLGPKAEGLRALARFVVERES